MMSGYSRIPSFRARLAASVCGLGCAPLCVHAPPAAPVAPSPVRVRAGEAGLTLRKVIYRRSALLRLSADPRRPGRPEEAASARLEFTLTARNGRELDRLVRGDLPVESFRAAGPPSKVRAAASVEAEGEELILTVTLSGLSPGAAALPPLEGSLPAYAEARRVRFHIPWLKDEVPLSVDFDGGRATLRHFRLVEQDSTLTVAVRPPEGFRVAPPEREGTLAARALDIYGNLVNGGGVTRTEQTSAGEEPEFRFFAPAMRKTPSRLALDVLFIRGEPLPLRFRLPSIPVPPEAP